MGSLVDFYSLFGFVFEYHKHGKGPFHYAAERDGFVFEIYPETVDSTTTHGIRLGFDLDDLDYALTKIEATGGKVIKPKHLAEFGEMAIVSDPDGRKIELKERK